MIDWKIAFGALFTGMLAMTLMTTFIMSNTYQFEIGRQAVHKIAECEKSLPRDQKCVIVMSTEVVAETKEKQIVQ